MNRAKGQSERRPSASGTAEKPGKKEDSILFLDTRFFRLLVGNPTDDIRRKWQEFHFERLNREIIPCTIITTPFKFLETIGVIPSKRYLSRFPFEQADENVPLAELGRLAQSRTQRILADGPQFYSELPELQLSHLRARVDFMMETQVAKNDFARFLAEDVMVRFSKLKKIDEQIYFSLALDDIQGVLVSGRNDDAFIMAQTQTLRELLNVSAAGYNVSFFRLLRSIFCSIEHQWLEPGFPSALPMKRERDWQIQIT